MRTLILLTTLFVLNHITADGQQLTAEIGRITSSFDYQNSDGVQNENLFPAAQNGYSIGVRIPLSKNKRLLYATGGLNYNGYGAKGNDSEYGNSYSWTTRFAGIRLGMDAVLFHKKAFNALVSLSAEPEMMISGQQTINNSLHDLKGVEQFDKPYMFYRGGVGLSYCLGSELAFTAKYTYGRGIALKASEDGETLRFISHQVSIGLMLSIKSCEYCYPKHFAKK